MVNTSEQKIILRIKTCSGKTAYSLKTVTLRKERRKLSYFMKMGEILKGKPE